MQNNEMFEMKMSFKTFVYIKMYTFLYNVVQLTNNYYLTKNILNKSERMMNNKIAWDRFITQKTLQTKINLLLLVVCI